jgi:hypothetical protein
MSQHTKRVVILFSLLISISVLTINSYGQGGSAEKTPPPSTKQPTRSSQPVKRGTTSSRGNRSGSSKPNTDTSSATPTLEETLKFIQNTVEAHPSGVAPTVSFTQLSGCRVLIKKLFCKPHEICDNNAIATLSLADINPESLEISMEDSSNNWYEMSFKTTGSKKKIKVEDNNSGQNFEPEGYSFYISVSDKETITRISNAFSHAVKLCGGKPDPF